MGWGDSVSGIANYVNPISGYRRGNDTNAPKWAGWLASAPVEIRDFHSVGELLSSGYLERGDLIYMEPSRSSSVQDTHMGFFWGATSSQNLFWHSNLYTDEGRVAGIAHGNMRSRITPSDMGLYRVIKVAHTG